jgi:hypothetical protein
LALANHSCVPNAAITFDERCVQLRCLDFIKKGEQIFISYIDHTQRRDTRRAELQDRYFFRCNCEKCTNDDNPYATLQKSKLDSSPRLNLLCNINAVKAHIDACIAHTTSPTISQELASLTAVLPQVGALLECSKAVTSKSERLYLLKNALSSLQPLQKHQLYAISPYPTVLHELYLFFLDNALFIPALTMLIFIFLNCDMYNYPQPHHPVRVLRLFTIAKILKHIASLSSDDFEENVHGTGIEKEVVCAVDWISAFQATLIMAAGLASRSHGENSRFKAEVEGELREVMEVQRLRGDVGDKLMLWGREEHEVEGREYARKLFEGLRALGGCAFAVSETTTV